MKQLPIQTESFRYLINSFQEWLDILGYSKSSVYYLPNHIREFFHWFENQASGNNIQQLEVHHIKTYYQELKSRSNQRRGGGLSNAYLNKHVQALHKFADYLRQSGRYILPTFQLIQESNDTATIEWLTQAEIQQLYQSTYGYDETNFKAPINARDRAMLTIYYSCGLRRNEGYHLNVSDINLDNRLVHVRKGKNNKERLVPFNKANGRYLEDYLFESRPQLIKDQQEQAFFLSINGKRMHSQSLAIRLKILQQRSDDLDLQKKEVRLHVLRHSIATHLLQNGMSLQHIQKFLGHTSLESTQIYTHLEAESKTGNQSYSNAHPKTNIQLSEDE